MKHPTQEEWMSYLYDELPVSERVDFQAHLGECAQCRSQLQTWHGVTKQMDQWQLRSRRKMLRLATFVRWAAAAAVVALALLGGARLLALNNEVKQLRVEVQRHSRPDPTAALARATEQTRRSANAEAQSLMTAVVQRLEEKRLADQQAIVAALQKLNTRHTEDFASLRKELETVAVFTEAGWQRAANEIANITYSPADSSNNK
jgi:hypothetical protein